MLVRKIKDYLLHFSIIYVLLNYKGNLRKAIITIFRKIWFKLKCRDGSLKFGRGGIIEKGFSIECNGEKSQINIGDNFYARQNGHIICENGHLEIEEDVFLNYHVSITCLSKIKIGKGTLIANNVVIVDHDHNMRDGDFEKSPVSIGNNVWIGANVTILKGVTVEDGAVVAAGAVVNKDVLAGTLVAGVPAKFVKNVEEL